MFYLQLISFIQQVLNDQFLLTEDNVAFFKVGGGYDIVFGRNWCGDIVGCIGNYDPTFGYEYRGIDNWHSITPDNEISPQFYPKLDGLDATAIVIEVMKFKEKYNL